MALVAGAACSSNGTPTGPSGGSSSAGSGQGGAGTTSGNGGQGSSVASTGSGQGGAGGQPMPMGGGGATPFAEYEAEDMETNAAVIGPSRKFSELPSEASGRRAVKLTNVGDHVRFTNLYAANSIVVRYSIPDGGADYWATIGVYVNDQLRTRLSVTSRYSWTYGDQPHFNQPDQNNPGLGLPHHFFDEAHAIIGDIPVGAKVMIQKDAADTASEYDIDLVDLEQVPDPLPKPAGFLSIVDDCGATPDDASDDGPAIQSCIDKVQGGGKPGLYIPKGEFKNLSKTLSTSNITIRGAGMWYSTISGFFARFDCWGNNCKYYDLAVFGDTTQRNDNSPETAFSGNGSSGTLLQNIWVEHSKVGYWTGPNTNGLMISHSRLRDLFADGVNFYGGTSNSVVEYTHARNTGDDAFASWSPNNQAVNSNNTFRNNVVQVPWMANCFGIYGGNDIVVQDNKCYDVVQYPGILLARQFDSRPFGGTIHVDRNALIRAGGFAYNEEQGAFKLHGDQASIQHVSVSDLEIIAPTFAGIHVEGPSTIDTVYFDKVTISSPGAAAFHLTSNATGAMDASNVVVTNAPSGVLDDSNGKFQILKGSGNMGW